MAGLLWMYQECTHELAEQWKSICEQFKPEDLQATFQFLQAHAEDFVIEFYQQMLLEEHADRIFVCRDGEESLKKLFISVANLTVLKFRFNTIITRL